MKILALECSSDQRSVAMLDDRVLLASCDEAGGRNTRVFGMIARALEQAGLHRDDIECLAVGLGPGSYTGIRSAIAVAQGWQLASGDRRVKLIGVSSAECLAAEAQAAGHRGALHVVIDAQRGDLYHAIYEINDDDCREIEALRLQSVEDLQRFLNTGESAVGPDCRRWFSHGFTLYPSAAVVGRLAACRTDFVSGEHLEPIYLRETRFVKAPLPRTPRGP